MADLVTVPPFGILEPPKVYKDGTTREDAESSPLDILLMPGLGFDMRGHRLGRGGGYYDKLVSRMKTAATSNGLKPPLLVALAFNAQVVPEIPTEEYDEAIDVLVTSTDMVACTERGQDFVKAL
eukprot:gene31179-6323_t